MRMTASTHAEPTGLRAERTISQPLHEADSVHVFVHVASLLALKHSREIGAARTKVNLRIFQTGPLPEGGRMIAFLSNSNY